MASRFGRNKKRKLRETAKNAVLAMDKANARAMDWAQEVDRHRHDLNEVIDKLERLLGPQSAVLPVKDVTEEFVGDECLRVLYYKGEGDPIRFREQPYKSRTWHQIQAVLLRLDTQLSINPDPLVRAQHIRTRVSLGHTRWGGQRVTSGYFVSADALRVLEAKTLIEETIKAFVKDLQDNFNVVDGRLVDRREVKQ